MKNYIILFVAIGFEVLGTMLLPATQYFTKLLPSAVSIASYVLSFYLLAWLSQKLPLAVIYSSWAGLGVFTIALFGYFFFNQTLAWQAIVGLFLIVCGVALVNTFYVSPSQ